MAEEKPFFLQGNFAPVSEERTETQLEVLGAIPPELRGLYVRNGANPITGESQHWFMGNGMVHGVRLEAGQARWYRNRYVKTPLLDDPDRQRVSDQGEIDHRVSAANTHIIGHAGRLLALEEGSFPFVLDDELETLGCEDFGGKLQTAFTAHPKVCPKTGELLAFGYGQLPPYLVYLRVSPEGKLVQSEEISVPGPTMMHDFAITEHYALFMDLPVVFDLQLALQNTMPFLWSDDYGARVGIMPRTGGNADVKWFEVEPCYVFHGMNAYEEGGEVVFDVCRANEMWRGGSEMATGETKLSFHRWRFDLASGTTKEETLEDIGVEFPRVADARVGQPYRYGFTVGFDGVGEEPTINLLHKFDLHSGQRSSHSFGDARHPGEPVFVRAEGSDPNSDEGWIVTYVHDDTRNKSELIILDATEMAKEPVARVLLPTRIPYGFHGSWIRDPGTQLS